MENNKPIGSGLINILMVVFVLDETILPVFHFSGISVKVSYLLLLAWFILYLIGGKLRIKEAIYDLRFQSGSQACKVWSRLLLLIVLSITGEITMLVYTNITNSAPFFNAILYYFFMASAFGLGYSLYSCNKQVFLYALYAYCYINIGLLMFYSSLPGFIRSLYSEYYITGIRIRGTGGNPNATMLIMNSILLSIVLLYRVKLIDIKGINIWLVFALPIITHIFVTSRGEFVCTLVLELFYLLFIVNNENNKAKTIGIFIVIGLVIFLSYIYVFKHLYYVNNNVRYSIDRLMRITEVTDIENDTYTADSILRPLYRLDVFWSRFKHSPIWGAGYSYGAASDFIKSADHYHNDWFRVLASTGIIGFVLWVKNTKYFYRISGFCILLPIIVAGLTNTFVQCVHAFNIYFFIFGVLSHWSEYNVQKSSKHRFIVRL